MQHTHELKQRAQKGFTLIELIITIVIIGVLAAVAIPKFQELSTEAETGVAASVGAALASSLSINYSRSKLPNAVACSVTVTTDCFYAITSCASIESNKANLADIPAGFSIAPTGAADIAIAPNGISVPGCQVQNSGATAAAAFNAYGAN